MDEYDQYLSGYQQAAVATENVAAVLNAGQGFILSAGLTAVLALAALLSPVGSFTAGDLVSSLPDQAVCVCVLDVAPIDCSQAAVFSAGMAVQLWARCRH